MDPARVSECTNETSPAPFDDQSEARSQVSQRSPLPNTERVESDEHHGLDRDATQDVADRDGELAARGGTVGDRDLREVSGHCEQDQPAESLTEVQPVGQHVGVVR